MSREARIFANGVTLYWDTDSGEMGIDATKRGYRYLEKRAKREGQTVDQYCRDVLTDALQSAGVKIDPQSFRSSIDE